MSNTSMLNDALAEHQDKKYYRLIFATSTNHDLSDLSLQLHGITGFYANEYFQPVKRIGRIFNVISDESVFKGHYGVSAVVIPYNTREQIEKNYDLALEELCEEYSLENIHFSEIFGQKVLGNRRSEFIKKYVDIVNELEMWSVSFSVNRSKFVAQLPISDKSDRAIKFLLFWNTFESLVEKMPKGSIFHIYFERDNYLSEDLLVESIRKLHSGLRQCQAIKPQEGSICIHPLVFTKKALFYSSISDLAAYSNTLIQQKLDHGIPASKVIANHRELIETTKSVFKYVMSVHQSKQSAAELILGV